MDYDVDVAVIGGGLAGIVNVVKIFFEFFDIARLKNFGLHQLL